MGVRLVRRSSPIRFNPQPAVAELGPAIVARMRARNAAGVDGNGAPMPGYSSLYRRQLAAMGESDAVDIKRSGALLADLRLLRVEVRGSVVTMVFGVGNGVSPQVARPPPWALSSPRALARWKASTKQARVSPPHQVLLSMLIAGGNGRAPRNILGLPPGDQRALVVLIEKAKVFSN